MAYNESGIRYEMKDGTLVAYIPEDVQLDGEAAQEAFREYQRKIRRAENAMTVLKTKKPLHGDSYDVIQQAAQLADEHDIRRWAVVTEEKVKGMAFTSNLDTDAEVKVFQERAEADEFVNGS